MPDRPNILFVISDQLIADLTGAYGHPVVQTPHLNRLAAEGVRFDSAYTPFPLCAPGRACITSGRHASEIGAWDNGALLAADVPSYAHYLSNSGYDTVLSGKMHFVGPDQVHGFHRRLTTDIYPPDFSWVKEEWIRIKETKGEDYEEVMDSRPTYNAGGYTGQAVRVNFWHNAPQLRRRDAIPRRRVPPRPTRRYSLLALRLLPPPTRAIPPAAGVTGIAMQTPKLPFPNFPTISMRPIRRWIAGSTPTTAPAASICAIPRACAVCAARNYGLVTYLDDKVGGLLATLEETGLLDNTVVVFTSDHGDMLCEKEMVQKRCFYEWSCRVPPHRPLPRPVASRYHCRDADLAARSAADVLRVSWCRGELAPRWHQPAADHRGAQCRPPHLRPSPRGGGRRLASWSARASSNTITSTATSRSFLIWRAIPASGTTSLA